jgi:hypothetical protein
VALWTRSVPRLCEQWFISTADTVVARRVIFGPDDAEPILGVTALESVGITIDPANRTLKRLPAIPLR